MSGHFREDTDTAFGDPVFGGGPAPTPLTPLEVQLAQERIDVVNRNRAEEFATAPGRAVDFRVTQNPDGTSTRTGFNTQGQVVSSEIFGQPSAPSGGPAAPLPLQQNFTDSQGNQWRITFDRAGNETNRVLVGQATAPATPAQQQGQLFGSASEGRFLLNPDGTVTQLTAGAPRTTSGGGGGGGGQSDASRLAIAQLQAQSRELGDKANNAARLGLQQDAQRFSAQQADIDRRINEFQFGVTAGLDRDRFGLEQQLGLGGLQLESAGLLNQLLQSPVDPESILQFINAGGGNIGNAVAGGFSALNERNLQPAAQALDVLRGIGGGSIGGGSATSIGTSGAVINGDDLVTSAISAPVSSPASVRNFAQRIAPPPEPIAPITPAGPGNIGPLSPQQLAGAREGQRQGIIASQAEQFFRAPPTREEFAAGVGRGQPIPQPALTIPGISAGESPGPGEFDISGGAIAANKGGTIPLGALASVGEGPSGKAPNRELILDLPGEQGIRVFNPEETKQIEKQGLAIPGFQAGGIFQPLRSDQLGAGGLPASTNTGIFQPAGQSSIEAVRGLREGAFVPQDFSLQQADFFNRSPTFQSAAPRGLAVRTGVTEADVLAEIKKFRLKGFGRGQLAIGA